MKAASGTEPGPQSTQSGPFSAGHRTGKPTGQPGGLTGNPRPSGLGKLKEGCSHDASFVAAGRTARRIAAAVASGLAWIATMTARAASRIVCSTAARLKSANSHQKTPAENTMLTAASDVA